MEGGRAGGVSWEGEGGREGGDVRDPSEDIAKLVSCLLQCEDMYGSLCELFPAISASYTCVLLVFFVKRE